MCYKTIPNQKKKKLIISKKFFGVYLRKGDPVFS